MQFTDWIFERFKPIERTLDTTIMMMQKTVLLPENLDADLNSISPTIIFRRAGLAATDDQCFRVLVEEKMKIWSRLVHGLVDRWKGMGKPFEEISKPKSREA